MEKEEEEVKKERKRLYPFWFQKERRRSVFVCKSCGCEARRNVSPQADFLYFMKNLISENCVLVMRIGKIQCTTKFEVVFMEL